MNTNPGFDTWRPMSGLSFLELDEEIKRIEIEKSRREMMKKSKNINWHANVTVH